MHENAVCLLRHITKPLWKDSQCMMCFCVNSVIVAARGCSVFMHWSGVLCWFRLEKTTTKIGSYQRFWSCQLFCMTEKGTSHRQSIFHPLFCQSPYHITWRFPTAGNFTLHADPEEKSLCRNEEVHDLIEKLAGPWQSLHELIFLHNLSSFHSESEDDDLTRFHVALTLLFLRSRWREKHTCRTG